MDQKETPRHICGDYDGDEVIKEDAIFSSRMEEAVFMAHIYASAGGQPKTKERRTIHVPIPPNSPIAVHSDVVVDMNVSQKSTSKPYGVRLDLARAVRTQLSKEYTPFEISRDFVEPIASYFCPKDLCMSRLYRVYMCELPTRDAAVPTILVETRSGSGNRDESLDKEVEVNKRLACVSSASDSKRNDTLMVYHVKVDKSKRSDYRLICQRKLAQVSDKLKRFIVNSFKRQGLDDAELFDKLQCFWDKIESRDLFKTLDDLAGIPSFEEYSEDENLNDQTDAAEQDKYLTHVIRTCAGNIVCNQYANVWFASCHKLSKTMVGMGWSKEGAQANLFHRHVLWEMTGDGKNETIHV